MFPFPTKLQSHDVHIIQNKTVIHEPTVAVTNTVFIRNFHNNVKGQQREMVFLALSNPSWTNREDL